MLGQQGKLGQLGTALDDFVDEVKPARRILSDLDEERLCRFCVVLAVADWLRKNWGDPPGFSLAAKNLGVDRMLSCIDHRIVRDVISLSSGFAATNAELMAGCSKMRVGGGFEGSSDVGGAEVDFIVDGCLYRVETSMKPFGAWLTTSPSCLAILY